MGQTVVNKLNRSCFFRTTLQLSISVLIPLFLCYSSGYSLFLHSFNDYFSAFLFKCFTHTLERKYVFLICNGILALLVRSSAIDSGSSSPLESTSTEVEASVVDGDVTVESIGCSEKVTHTDQEEQEREEKPAEEEEEEEEEEEQAGDENGCLDREEDEESVVLVAEDEENERVLTSGALEKNEDVRTVAATANEDSASADELNKRFEEFIRKMKAQISGLELNNQ